MGKLLLSGILLIVLNQHLFTQKTYRLSGYITDKQTGEVLIGANIIDVNNNIGCTSNKFGYYSFLMKENNNPEIHYSYLGYSTHVLVFNTSKDSVVNVQLSPNTLSIKELIITPSRINRIEQTPEIGKTNIPIETIKSLPSITGEPDILKAYQLMPGIQSGTEGNNGLYVRGGTPDQNLFLLDDVPLYNVSHLGGLFSVFDPSMVKSVDIYKAGFPARYGGRVSSVADVRNKEGNLFNWNSEISLNLFLTKLFIEGPIKKEKSSIAFSVRRSNLDVYTYVFNRLSSANYNQGYNFYDINLKANFKISDRNRLFFSIYSGRDKFYFKEKDTELSSSNLTYSSQSNLNWGNTATSARWLHIIKSNVFNNTTIAYSKYNYENENKYLRTDHTDNSTINDQMLLYSSVRDIIFKNDTEFSLHNSRLKAGLLFTLHNYIPGYAGYIQSDKKVVGNTLKKDMLSDELEASELFGYIEYENQINSKLASNIGLRVGTYITDSSQYNALEPRVVINYLFLPRASLKLSYCIMNQNIHLLTNSNTGLPSDTWVPSTSLLKPERSHQYSIGLAHTTNSNIEISIEAYLKKLTHLIEYKEGVLIYNSEVNWEDKIEKKGTGTVKGIEFLFSKKQGLINGWLGYTLSMNTRKFPHLNNGADYPFKYDQRHNISVVCNCIINKKLNVSGSWVYHSGNRLTLPTSKYMIYEYTYSDVFTDTRDTYTNVHVYGKKNGYQMPDFHRLDVGLNYTKAKPKGEATWTIGIYNVYNRQNAYYLYFKETDKNELTLYQQSILPILLNFGYTYKFK